jgi:solute carrier family 25 aspartate/glutamate transporter 12/13
MKSLQGERLRQAFKYLDTDQDGFIRPEEFKRIVLVSARRNDDTMCSLIESQC